MNWRVPALLALAAPAAVLLVAACGSSGSSPSRGSGDIDVASAIQTSCSSTTPPACTKSLHFADVEPIFQKSCVSCHSGPSGPSGQWPLIVYNDIAPWAGAVQDQLCGNTMPPVDGGVPMAESDRLTILDWVACGAPE